MGLPVGARLGPYEIVAPLGAGGMGEVYRAHDTRLGRDVAIKVLPAGFTADPLRVSRFEREARLVSALNHPNIVTIHDIGWSETTPYIAMELVKGSTVRDRLRSGTMTMRQKVAVTTQIAEGLAEAHEAGIVHRDLKPENVMITTDGLVKILDFGLGKHDALFRGATPDGATTQLTTPATADGRIVGTVDYMSPEQAAGHPVDFRSDQFSFGSIVCEMLTGTSPFHRDTVVQTLSAIIETSPRLPSNITLPELLRRVVERCLAKDPGSRYPSTLLMATELRALAAVPALADTPLAPASMHAPRFLRAKWVITGVLMALALAAIVAGLPPVRSFIADRMGPTVIPFQSSGTLPVRPNATTVVPYWTLSAINLLVLVGLAAAVLALDRRGAVVRAFAVVLFLRGLVGVTATLGDGATARIARLAIALDAGTSALLSGAFVIFVLLYPRRRLWAGRRMIGAIALVAIWLAAVSLTVPSALGVFTVTLNGTLTVVAGGAFLWERAAYIIAGAICAAILAVEHGRVAKQELRRSVLLVGIAFATFPIYVAATLLSLGFSASRVAFAAYGGAPTAVGVIVSGAIALLAAFVFASTEVRHGDRRAAIATLIASGIAAATGVVGVRLGGVPTVAGNVSFVLRALWRFPLPILATYALLRHQLLGIDVHLKWTIRRGTLAAIFLAAFLIVAQVIQIVAGARLAYIAGAIAAALLLFVLAPLQDVARRFADAALPRVHDPRAAPPARRLDAYRQAVELVLADGVVTPHKERALAALADELGIGALESLEVRDRALGSRGSSGGLPSPAWR